MEREVALVFAVGRPAETAAEGGFVELTLDWIVLVALIEAEDFVVQIEAIADESELTGGIGECGCAAGVEGDSHALQECALCVGDGPGEGPAPL